MCFFKIDIELGFIYIDMADLNIGINDMLQLTFADLKLMIQNRDSKLVITDQLSRYILYASYLSMKESSFLNEKKIQAECKQSFYVCNKSIQVLKDGGWILEEINSQDRRIKNILPTKKAINSILAYEQIKINSLLSTRDIYEPGNSITLNIEDLIEASESQLKEMSDQILRDPSEN